MPLYLVALRQGQHIDGGVLGEDHNPTALSASTNRRCVPGIC
jgi:hypothetical protein